LIVEITAGRGAQLGEQRVKLAGIDADAIKRVLVAQFLEQLAQRVIIPLRELVSSVVGDRVGQAVEFRPVEPNHRRLAHAQRARGLQSRVARDHLAEP
jgi:hypothetical protein